MWLFAMMTTILALNFLPGPYIWIFLVWSLVFLVASIRSRTSTTRILCANLFGMLFILTGAEAYYFYDIHLSSRWNTNTFDRVYETQRDPLLGYRSIPNTQRTAREFHQNQPVYEVKVSINSDGYRISPPFVPTTEGRKQSILFFGGSFTYGEGVNDQETMPFITGLLTKGQYKIYNFGLHGYGPQHMLANIDHDLVDTIVDTEPRYIIYQVLEDHVSRVAGHRGWLKSGPQYILSKNGEVQFSGSFNTCNPSYENCLWKGVMRNFEKSFFLQRFFLHRISSTDLDLFTKVVDRSRYLLKKKYPQAEFHIIFWHNPWRPISNKILDDLKQHHFKTHLITDIIPDIYENKEGLYRIPHDGHPTPRVHKEIAQYIANNIIHAERDDHEDLIKNQLPKISRDQSLPAFSRVSFNRSPYSDQPRGPITKKLKRVYEKQIDMDYINHTDRDGGINLYQRWDTHDIVDTPQRWEMSIWLADHSLEAVGIMDITPRRAQRFKLQAGERVRWQVEGEIRQSGTVLADQFGLVTLPAVKIGKSKSRIRIEK